MWRNPRRLRPPGGCPRAPALPPQGTAHCSNPVTVMQRHPATFFRPRLERSRPTAPAAAMWLAKRRRREPPGYAPAANPRPTAEHADHRRSPRGAREAGPLERRSPHQRHRRRGLAILAWHRPRGRRPTTRTSWSSSRGTTSPHRTGTPPRQTGPVERSPKAPRNLDLHHPPLPQPP